MRDTIRDLVIAAGALAAMLGAAAALFAAVQAHNNGLEIARLNGIAQIAAEHVNAAGLHR